MTLLSRRGATLFPRHVFRNSALSSRAFSEDSPKDKHFKKRNWLEPAGRNFDRAEALKALESEELQRKVGETGVVPQVAETFTTTRPGFSDERSPTVTAGGLASTKRVVEPDEMPYVWKFTHYMPVKAPPILSPKKIRGNIQWKDWPTLKQAILNTPSGRMRVMPSRKELRYHYKGADKGPKWHGGWMGCAIRLKLEFHRK